MSRKVLVVDDEEAILDLLSIYLEEEGYEVAVACNGEEALNRFRHGHWDLVLTDRMMPGMSGDELGESIRRLDQKIPIVLVSGFTEPHMGQFPFDAIVAKPFEKEVLIATLHGIDPHATR
jgi:CheY-like chemotaxis protein